MTKNEKTTATPGHSTQRKLIDGQRCSGHSLADRVRAFVGSYTRWPRDYFPQKMHRNSQNPPRKPFPLSHDFCWLFEHLSSQQRVDNT